MTLEASGGGGGGDASAGLKDVGDSRLGSNAGEQIRENRPGIPINFEKHHAEITIADLPPVP